jgi:hypothetical protein
MSLPKYGCKIHKRIYLTLLFLFFKQKKGIKRQTEMDEQIKKNVKKFARDAENKVARSILRWKYKKEGKQVPVEDQLENESRYVAEKAHQVIAKRGKTVLNELKKVYFKSDRKEEDPGE